MQQYCWTDNFYLYISPILHSTAALSFIVQSMVHCSNHKKCIAWAMFNAYIIEEKFRQCGRKCDFCQFQLEVIHQLVGENRFRRRKRGRPASTDNVTARITDTPHMPSMSDSTDHRWQVCVEKHKRYNRSHPEASYADNPLKKVKTSFLCDGCNVFLCMKKGSVLERLPF